MEQTECSETSAYKIQTPGNYPEESIQHSEHGESLRSRRVIDYKGWFYYTVATLCKPLTACLTRAAPDEWQQHGTCSSDKNTVNVSHIL